MTVDITAKDRKCKNFGQSQTTRPAGHRESNRSISKEEECSRATNETERDTSQPGSQGAPNDAIGKNYQTDNQRELALQSSNQWRHSKKNHRAVARMVGHSLPLLDELAMWHLASVLYVRLKGRERAFLAVSVLCSLTDDEYEAVIEFCEGKP